MSILGDQYIPDLDELGGYGHSGGGGGGGLRKIVMIVGAAVLVAAIGFGVYWWLFLHKSAKPVLKSGNTYSTQQATINLSDGHLIQVDVVMQLSNQADTKAIGKDNAKLMDAEISIFGAMNFQELLTPLGKSTAKLQLTTQFNNIVGKVNGFPQVLGVYFTDFVMQ